MRVDNWLVLLRDTIQNNPKPVGQSEEDRAVFVLSKIIAQYDQARENEVRANEEAAKNNPGWYSLLEVKTARTYVIDVPDFPAFCALHKLNQDALLKVALGDELEYKGFRRANMVGSLGHMYKPPRPVSDAYVQKKLAVDVVKMQKNLDAQRVTLPPEPSTHKFIPQGDK